MKSPPIFLLLERIGRIIANDGHASGLKPTQWEVLRYLGRANRFSRNPTALTSYLGTTKGTVSQTVSTLTRKGLVKKSSNPDNRRAIKLDLTEAGLALLDDDPLASAFASAAEAQDSTLALSLQRLLGAVIDERGGRPFGVCKTCVHFERQDTAEMPNRCRLLELPLTKDDSERICVEHESQLVLSG